jgi:hypothetical protein
MSGGFCEPRHVNGSAEHRVAVGHLFVFVLNSVTMTPQTIAKLQQAFGNDVMSKSQDFPWHNTISEGRTLVEVEQRSGRPSAKRTGYNTALVRELVRSDGRLTVRIFADKVVMNRKTVLLTLMKKRG